MILKLHNIRMEPSNVRKKIKEPPNVTKIQSYVMFVFYNMRMEPSNVRKKKKEPQNVTKVMSNVILELYNVRMKSLNVRKKYKRTTKCDKKYCQICVGIAQCDDVTIKCDNKKK